MTDLIDRAEALIRDPRMPVTLAAAAIAATSVLLVVWLSDLTFWRDEWAFLLHRRGFDADVFLRPNYEHIVAGAVVVYKALQGTFGMDSPAPFQVFFVASFAVSVALLFVYVRRRTEAWLALAAILPILVLGTSPEDLLWPFQMGFTIGMCFGLGALLALDRGDRRGDILACALLVVALTPSSLGVAFIPGALVHVCWGPDRWRRIWVVGIPAVLYGLWYLGWGQHASQSFISLHNILTAPGYVLDGFASSVGSLTGLGAAGGGKSANLEWGRPLLAIASVAAAWRVRQMGGLTRSLAVVLAIGISFWALGAFNASLFREATSGRYQYMGAFFLVLIAAELLRGVRLDPRVGAGVLAVSVAAAISNLALLHDQWTSYRPFGQLQPAGLAALEIARDRIDPGFELTLENSGVDYLGELDAGPYWSAVDAFGSPAFTEAELSRAPEYARVAADQVFGAGFGLRLAQSSGGATTECERVNLVEDLPAVVTLARGGADIDAAPGASAKVDARRYAAKSFPLAVGTLGPGEEATLEIPTDDSDEPWELALTGAGRIDVCARSPA